MTITDGKEETGSRAPSEMDADHTPGTAGVSNWNQFFREIKQ